MKQRSSCKLANCPRRLQKRKEEDEKKEAALASLNLTAANVISLDAVAAAV